MSQEERDRLHWLKLARDGKITQQQAAERMRVTSRWVRKLLRKLKRKGDRAVVHGLRNRPSNQRIAEAVRRRATELVRTEYRDFGPTLAAEYLSESHAIQVSKETLRKWMIEAKLWRPKRAKITEVHVWRPRRECFGELVQWDTSEHGWLEGRGAKLYLVAMIDDASSRALARFVEHDTAAENMRLLWGWLERFGLADRRLDRVEVLSHGNQQRVQLAAELHRVAPTRARHSISTAAPSASPLAPRVERAGGPSGKKDAYTRFMAA